MTDPTAPLVLLIEDDAPIRRYVSSALHGERLRVEEADTLAHGHSLAANHPPDLIVLDLGLPDGDGVDFIADLRAWSTVPILVLSARNQEADKVRALDAGADDYLSKPFGTSELLARVRAQLRRRSRQVDSGSGGETHFGEVEVDLLKRTVSRAGQPVALTPLEYRLLTVFLANPGKVLTHQQLLREVWGPGQTDKSHYLRIFVAALRKKLEADPARPVHLRTETGVGYRLVL